MNSENSKTSDTLMLNFDLIDLRRGDSRVALSQQIYYTWKNIKRSCGDNKSEIPRTTWDQGFELPGGFYFISDVQDFCKYIIKRHEAMTDKLYSYH